MILTAYWPHTLFFSLYNDFFKFKSTKWIPSLILLLLHLLLVKLQVVRGVYLRIKHGLTLDGGLLAMEKIPRSTIAFIVRKKDKKEEIFIVTMLLQTSVGIFWQSIRL